MAVGDIGRDSQNPTSGGAFLGSERPCQPWEQLSWIDPRDPAMTRMDEQLFDLSWFGQWICPRHQAEVSATVHDVWPQLVDDQPQLWSSTEDDLGGVEVMGTWYPEFSRKDVDLEAR